MKKKLWKLSKMIYCVMVIDVGVDDSSRIEVTFEEVNNENINKKQYLEWFIYIDF